MSGTVRLWSETFPPHHVLFYTVACAAVLPTVSCFMSSPGEQSVVLSHSAASSFDFLPCRATGGSLAGPECGRGVSYGSGTTVIQGCPEMGPPTRTLQPASHRLPALGNVPPGPLKAGIMPQRMKVTPEDITSVKAVRGWLFLQKPWPLWDGPTMLPHAAGIALSVGQLPSAVPCLASLGKLRHIRGSEWDQNTYLPNVVYRCSEHAALCLQTAPIGSLLGDAI